MAHVTSGKRAGPGRHAGPARLQETAPPSASKAPLLLLALGITAAVVGWGYLVYLAIDFGGTARNGDTTAWWFLGMATVGAIACLFVALTLGTRFATRLRAGASPPPRPPGGRRAAR